MPATLRLKLKIIICFKLKTKIVCLHQWIACTHPINKTIKLTKKSIDLLDAVTSVPYSMKGLEYYRAWSRCRLSFHLLLLLVLLLLWPERKINESPVPPESLSQYLSSEYIYMYQCYGVSILYSDFGDKSRPPSLRVRYNKSLNFLSTIISNAAELAQVWFS
jgi:hypothetical protein